MITIRQSEVFTRWLRNLRDVEARIRIGVRLDRLADGNPGQVRGVGDSVSELKIDYGPGYRVYFTWRDGELILLLCGGDKSLQREDIERAKRIEREYEEGKPNGA